MKIINTEKMIKSNGHYSQCIEHGGILYLSGQLPLDPVTGGIPGGIEKQTKQALDNMENILIEAGSCREKVLRVRVYVADILLWGDVDRIYSSFFGDHKPARCVIPAGELHFGALIEIDATAYID